MQVQTQVEFNVTLGSSQGLYDRNLDATIMRSLRESYSGKCLDGQYIVSLDRLVKRSLPNLIRRDLDAKVRCFAVVEATVIRYDSLDVVCDLKVAKIIPRGKVGAHDMLQCSNGQCKVLMKLASSEDDTQHPYAPGDIIPVKVGAALLKIQSEQVLINACPFIPHPPNMIAHKLSSISVEEYADYVRPIIDMVVKSKAAFEARKSESPLAQTRVEFFTELLTTFNTKTESIGTQVDLLELLSNVSARKGLYAWVDHSNNLADMKVSLVTQRQMNERGLIAGTLSGTNSRRPLQATLHAIAVEYAKHLHTIVALSRTYEKQEVFDHHQYLWTMYAANRL